MSDDIYELERVSPADEALLIQPGYPHMPSYYEGSSYGYGTPSGEEEEGGINLREVWRIIRKRKWLILCVALIITTLVAIEAYRTKSTYRASAFIEIGKDSPSVRAAPAGMVIQGDEDIYFPQLTINTNLFRLTSEPLLEDVVANLKLDENPKFTEPSQRSLIEAVQAIFTRAAFIKPDPEPATKVGSLISRSDERQPLSQEDHDRLGPYVSMLAGGLVAEQVKDTRTLKVTYTHTDATLAAAVANGVAQDFINQTFENRTERFTSASTWLDTTTRELKAKVESADQQLADYTKTHNIFSIEGKESLTIDNLQRLHDQATRAGTERILKQSVYEEVKAGRLSDLPAAFSDLKISAFQTKLDELEANLAKLSLKYGPEHKAIVEAKVEISSTRAQLEASRKALENKLKGEYALALRDEESLKTALAGAKGEAVSQNQANIEYNMLKTELDTAKALYKEFLEKTNQAKVEVAQQHNNMRLIQPARVPGGPIGPNRMRTIMIGLFIGLLGGVGFAYFLEYLDHTIKTVEDVGRYTQLPALGVIPVMPGSIAEKLTGGRKRKSLTNGKAAVLGRDGLPLTASSSLTVFDSNSFAAEAYRVVRTSMLLSAAGSPPKIVLVTSAQPGEGKSTTVVNTAISLAQLGSAVLIIDCDLRRPSTHKILGVTATEGLSSYLTRDIDIDPLIIKLPISNLSLLPCGPIPPNPAELISSSRMRDLLKEMSLRYDHILIDSPPMMNVTDPVILSRMVDGVMLVVHGGKSPRTTVQRARQELQGVGAKIYGVVLNNIDLRREGYDSHYYYYNRYYGDYASNKDHS